MNTRVSIKYRDRTANQPGFELYDDVLDIPVEDGDETPVYLQLDGVAAQMETMQGGNACVTITLPRKTARELGLLPEAPVGNEA
jgi:hypothetical protein